jgi:urease subunit alpha
MSAAGIANKVPEKLGLERTVVAVSNCRKIGKKDLKLNFATPDIKVNSETYEVSIDGEVLTCEPAEVLPMAQRYFLF